MTGHRLHFLEEAYEELGAAYEWYAQRSHRAAAVFASDLNGRYDDLIKRKLWRAGLREGVCW